MNKLSIDCTCGKRLSVSEGLEGKRVRCPGCSAVLTVNLKPPTQTSVLACRCGQPLRVPADSQGRQIRCPKCSEVMSIPTNSPMQDSADPFGNLDKPLSKLSPFTPPASKPLNKRASAPRTKSGYRNYSDVPWIRKSGAHHLCFILQFLTCFAIPFLLFTCVVLVTGPVYYNQKEPDGSLKKWSPANTVVAFLLLIPSLLVMVIFAVGFARGFMNAVWH